MSSVIVERVSDVNRSVSPALREIEKTFHEIERRAFNLFQERGATPGWELEDWLKAEREMVWAPPSEMTDRGNDYMLRIAAPGLDPGQVQVTATPQTIIVQANRAHRHEETGSALCFCEFKERVFRRFDLPGRIDLDKVSARLEKGILEIAAPKARGDERKQIQVMGQQRQGHSQH
jgi:HSP20 family protein